MTNTDRADKPRVSVIMPTYNDRFAIEAAIESILGQTLDAWELIVVDDASTDGTADFVEERFKDPRITLVRMDQNSGSGACRNRAIEISQADFIAVMDADDISLPNRLRRQLDRLKEDPGLGAVSAQVMEFGDWGGPAHGNWPTDPSDIMSRQLNLKMPIPHPATMFRRDVLLAAGGYDVSCRRAQDYSLFLQLQTTKLETLDEPLVMYRTNRPIGLRYVLRNEQYAELARARFRLKAKGHPAQDLPTEPRTSLLLYLRTLKSWSVRNLREALQHKRSSKNSK